MSNKNPEKNGNYMVLNSDGFLGIARFDDGDWFSLPTQQRLKKLDFFWIDNENSLLKPIEPLQEKKSFLLDALLKRKSREQLAALDKRG